jgi:preprotein translocase subunit Sec63
MKISVLKHLHGDLEVEATMSMVNMIIHMKISMKVSSKLQKIFLEGSTFNFDKMSALGVNMEASESDIKKAYRKLSLKYHPGTN